MVDDGGEELGGFEDLEVALSGVVASGVVNWCGDWCGDWCVFCAYALHAPSLSLAGWTVHRVPQAVSILCQIDVLQCIVYSLLILHGLARLIRRPLAYAGVALVLALAVALAAPHVWQPGVADGWWPPIRGLINGNPDQGVGSLFPLFPWFAFAALRLRPRRALSTFPGDATRGNRPLERTALVACPRPAGWRAVSLGNTARANIGWMAARSPPATRSRLYNMTLPSVAERLGLVCAAGAIMGWLEMIRGRWRGPNWVLTASRESLLLYMLHLNLIFGLLLAPGIRAAHGMGTAHARLAGHAHPRRRPHRREPRRRRRLAARPQPQRPRPQNPLLRPDRPGRLVCRERLGLLSWSGPFGPHKAGITAIIGRDASPRRPAHQMRTCPATPRNPTHARGPFGNLIEPRDGSPELILIFPLESRDCGPRMCLSGESCTTPSACLTNI